MNKIITGSGINVSLGQGPFAATPPGNLTETSAASFDTLKHVFSEKPLRRPNRVRPIEEPKRKKRRRKSK